MAKPKGKPNVGHGITRIVLARGYRPVNAEIDPKSKSVLVCLASHCSDRTPNKTWVSVDTIADETSWAMLTVIRALKQLSELGVITRHIRGGNYRSSRNTILNWDLIAANQIPDRYSEESDEDQSFVGPPEGELDNNTSILDVIPAPAITKTFKTNPIPQVQPARQPAKPFFEFELDENEDVEVIVKPTPVSPIIELVQRFRSEIPGHKSFKPTDYSAAVVRTLQKCATDCEISETALVAIAESIYKDTETSALVKKCGSLGAYLSTAITNRLAAPSAETAPSCVHIHITREMCADWADGIDPFSLEQRAVIGPKTQMLNKPGDHAGRQLAADPRFFDENREPRYIDNPAEEGVDCIECMGTRYVCTSLTDDLGNILTLHSDAPCEACCCYDDAQSYDAQDYADDAAAYSEERSW